MCVCVLNLADRWEGCRAGESCPFLHETAVRSQQQSSTTRTIPERTSVPHPTVDSASTSKEKSTSSRNASSTIKSQVVGKPVSNAEKSSPRDFQLSQIRRRFSPIEKEDESKNAVLTFKLSPSDPDFPFELDALSCTLVVPASYPKGKPTLKVSNSEMERGYQINVERGFETLVQRNPSKTLLALMNDFDRNLESFLTPEKAQTIKLVTNAGPPRVPQALEVSNPMTTVQRETKREAIPPRPTPTYTAQQRADAEARRTTDIRQLEARMGRQSLFSKFADDVTFTVPIQPKTRNLLPVCLQNINTVKLIVPTSYNLDPCRIQISDTSIEARAVENSFKRRAQEHPEMSLMNQLNMLCVNMHLMAKEDHVPEPTFPVSIPASNPISEIPSTDTKQPSQAQELSLEQQEKSHIQIIPRPPEWNQLHEGTDDEDTYSDTYDSEGDLSASDEEGGVDVPLDSSTAQPERGVLLSFPFLELYGIELMELTSLSLTIKCDRCKESKDVKGIRSQTSEQTNSKNESCNKCGNFMVIGR